MIGELFGYVRSEYVTGFVHGLMVGGITANVVWVIMTIRERR